MHSVHLNYIKRIHICEAIDIKSKTILQLQLLSVKHSLPVQFCPKFHLEPASSPTQLCSQCF